MIKCFVNTRGLVWFIHHVLTDTGLNYSFYFTKDKPYLALTSSNSSSVYVKVEQAALKINKNVHTTVCVGLTKSDYKYTFVLELRSGFAQSSSKLV